MTDTDPAVTSTGPKVTITGLVAGTNYWIDVRAENSVGQSTYTAALATSTRARLTAPRNLRTLVGVTEASIGLWWDPVIDADRYQYRYRETGEVEWGVWADQFGTYNYERLSGLVWGTQYDIQVRAVQDNLVGPPSNVHTETTATPSIPMFAEVGGPSQSWFRNRRIRALQVPAAEGIPLPTYAVVGTLPVGLSFERTTGRRRSRSPASERRSGTRST